MTLEELEDRLIIRPWIGGFKVGFTCGVIFMGIVALITFACLKF